MRGRFSRQVEADPQSITVTGHSAHHITGKNWHHPESPWLSWLHLSPQMCRLFWSGKLLPCPDYCATLPVCWLQALTSDNGQVNDQWWLVNPCLICLSISLRRATVISARISHVEILASWCYVVLLLHSLFPSSLPNAFIHFYCDLIEIIL